MSFEEHSRSSVWHPAPDSQRFMSISYWKIHSVPPKTPCYSLPVTAASGPICYTAAAACDCLDVRKNDPLGSPRQAANLHILSPDDLALECLWNKITFPCFWANVEVVLKISEMCWKHFSYCSNAKCLAQFYGTNSNKSPFSGQSTSFSIFFFALLPKITVNLGKCIQ